ncbi:hypothetical protein SUGI_0099410 [Cryptomeria japonica]|nr:hypothetical protein SUGI_0099410 [Cryptomeria japonica]
MVGGPTKGTRFRPLSLNIAKPLFPLAGFPMVHHPILSCKKIPNLAHIYLIGFYDERLFTLYLSNVSSELKIPVRYLCEDKPHGSAGALFKFRDLLMEDSPKEIFVMHCDICCSFPLGEMQMAHRTYGGIGTILVKKVSTEATGEFGELVADTETKELLHFAEKPETHVSDYINCGVYIFTPDIFHTMQNLTPTPKQRGYFRRLSSFESLEFSSQSVQKEFIRLDEDLFTPLVGKKKIYTYETLDVWEQIKTPRMSLKCSSLYLKQYRLNTPELLSNGDASVTANIIGDVYVHPSSKIHPTAKIGPNVSISANARIGPGVRLSECIILDDVEVQDNAIVMHAIIGWKSSIGKWARVQGQGKNGAKNGISILGEGVVVEDEVVVLSSTVLPHKSLNRSVQGEIIL